MSANPIGLVVVAIVALVAAVVIAYKRSEKFRAVVDGAFRAVKNVITGTVGAVVGFVRSHWPLLLAILTGPFGLAVLAIAKNRDKLIGIVSGIKGKVLGIFGKAAHWLTDAGKAIIGGLLDGIESMIGKVKDKLKGLTNLIPKLKGPLPKDKRLLRPAGEGIMDGLINAIDSRIPRLRRSLRDVTAEVEGVSPQLDAGLTVNARGVLASATGAGGAVPPISIVVQGALDPNAVANQIVTLLVDLARRLGVPVAQLFTRAA